MIQSMSWVLGTRRLLSEDMYHPAHVTRSLIRRITDAADGERFDLNLTAVRLTERWRPEKRGLAGA